MKNLTVERTLGDGITTDINISEDAHQTILQGSKAAFDLAFGLRAGELG